MWWIWLVVIGGLILLITVLSVRYAKVSKKKKEEYEKGLKAQGFYIEQVFDNFDSLLYIDYTKKLWSLKESNKSPVVINSFLDIFKMDLYMDGVVLVSGNAGGILKGKIKFSEDNNNRTDEKGKIKQACADLTIELTMFNRNLPVKKIKLLGVSTKFTDETYIKKAQMAEDMVIALTKIMNIIIPEIPVDLEKEMRKEAAQGAAKTLEQRGRESGQSTAEKMRQLEDLKIKGLISEQEYALKREDLLRRL